MSNKSVCADFCAQVKTSGKGSNLYFKGNQAWSYGPHFPLAVIRGTRIYINCSKYSSSTTRHQSCMRQAAIAAGLTITERSTAEMP